MDERECEVCTKMVKEKYKHYKTWKILAIVFMIVAVVFAILYFASGNLMVEETVENNIRIENADGSNENNIITSDNSTISGTVKTESNTGGILGGCYIISKNKSHK